MPTISTIPRKDDHPRNLAEARSTILKLKARLGLAEVPESLQPRAAALVRGVMPPQSPGYPTQARPRVAAPPPASSTEINLAALAPRALRDFFDACTSVQLRGYLSVETSKGRKDQNPNIIGSIYRELKKRRQA